MPRRGILDGRPDRLPPRRRLPSRPPGYDDPAAAKERDDIRAAAKRLSERATRAAAGRQARQREGLSGESSPAGRPPCPEAPLRPGTEERQWPSPIGSLGIGPPPEPPSARR